MYLSCTNICRSRSSRPQRKMYPTILLTVLYPGPDTSAHVCPWSQFGTSQLAGAGRTSCKGMASSAPKCSTAASQLMRCPSQVSSCSPTPAGQSFVELLKGSARPAGGTAGSMLHPVDGQRRRAAGPYFSTAATILLGPGQLGAGGILCVGSMPHRTLHHLVISLDRCTCAGHFESSQTWFFGTLH